MNKILVVVDMQKQFVKECGAFGIVSAVAEKIKTARAEGCDVLLTYDKSGGELCGEITELSLGCKVYKKRSYGCKQLILDLAAIKPDEIEFVGVCTDICVITNVLGAMAFLPDSQIVVYSRCCASTPSGHSAALRVMEACNITVK